jgi:4-hydroxymandelate oxidase
MTCPMDLSTLEQRAQQVVPGPSFDYVAGGADEEVTLRDNVAAWARLRIRPRMLRDVSRIDLSTSLLGAPVRSPIIVAPTAYHRLVHDEGERATVRGAHAAQVPFILSTMSTVSIEDVAASEPGALRWFQIYVHRDRELTSSMISRAEAAGYRALVLTVDTPRLGRRRRHGPGGFVLPPGIEAANLVGTAHDTTDLASYADAAFDPALTYEAVRWLCGQTALPVVVKGILRGDDALACIDAGATAIAVSNHGGRQLDGVIATADALVEVVRAVGDRGEVYVDGGLRNGTDVLRALALGARAVLIGRPAVWGLALDGSRGVRDVLTAFVDDTEAACALAGVRSCADAGPDLLV